MATPYNPGAYPPREFGLKTYSVRQEIRWRAYNRAYYSLYEGRLGTLHPTPGFSYDTGEFEQWQDRFLAGGVTEAGTRGKGLARPLAANDYPGHVWVWIYQRMLAAEEFVADG